MKLLLIGNSQSHLAKRLKEEALKLGHHLSVLNCRRIIIDTLDGTIRINSRAGKNLLDFDRYFFYGLGQYLPIACEVAKYLKQQGKKVVEASLGQGFLPNDKLSLVEHEQLRTVPYQYYSHLTRKQATKLKFPLIVKKLNSSLGRGIALITNHEELETFLASSDRSVIVQKYLPIKSDYRVIVVGNNALGTMERFRSSGDFLTTRPGFRRAVAQLPPSITNQCVQAVKAKGLEIAGVDLVKYRGKYYCFEINSSPQIRVFEKTTGINVAQSILNFLIKKSSTH